MIRGIQTAAAGMTAHQHALDVIANNLANVGTNGFKQDVPAFADLHILAVKRYEGGPSPGVPLGSLGNGAGVDAVRSDASPGSVVPTRSPLDLALLGDGYFTVQTPRGDRYTRDGQFRAETTRGAGGGVQVRLVDGRGYPVLGEAGPIDLTGRTDVRVSADGTVTDAGKPFAKLLLRSAAPGAVTKEGDNLLAIAGAPLAATPTVRSSALEQSNVNAVASLARMIQVQRSYEAMQRAIVAQDETLGRAVNDVGRV